MKITKKIITVGIIIVIILTGLLILGGVQQEKQLFNEYTLNTRDNFELFMHEVEALNNGSSITYRDLTGSYIQFVASSSEWNQLYYDLDESDRLPKGNYDTDYTATDFRGDVKELYYDVVELYFLNDDIIEVEDKESISNDLKYLEVKMNSFELFK